MANVFDNITAVKHCVAESSLLKATKCGHIYSLKCHANLDNGSIVSVGDFVEPQVYKTKAYVAGEAPVLILTPPLGYNSDRKSYQDECYFYNAQNEIARGYELAAGDIFTVSKLDASVTTPAVGNILDASYKIWVPKVLDNTATTDVDESVAGSSGICLEIIEIVVRTDGSKAYRLAVRDLNRAAAVATA